MNLKFNTLVNLHENQVFSLALQLLRDRGEAEDITQETFIKLWENLPKVDLVRARPWLLQVTRNACFDRMRRRNLERGTVSPGDEADVSGSPERLLEQDQVRNRVSEAIAALDEPYRTLVILRDIQHNSYRDIERILELSADQVKVYLYRARQKLKRILNEVEV